MVLVYADYVHASFVNSFKKMTLFFDKIADKTINGMFFALSLSLSLSLSQNM